jgi:hypothetical protein
MNKNKIVFLLTLCTALTAVASEKTDSSTPVAKSSNKVSTVDGRVRQLKLDVLELNRELFELEEALLFPATTELTVYVSLASESFFKLDAINLHVDEKSMSKHLYTQRQINALTKGGVQKLFTGNIRPGKHQFIASLQGRDEDAQNIEETITLAFEKSSHAKYLEIRISDDEQSKKAIFDVVQW